MQYKVRHNQNRHYYSQVQKKIKLTECTSLQVVFIVVPLFYFYTTCCARYLCTFQLRPKPLKLLFLFAAQTFNSMMFPLWRHRCISSFHPSSVPFFQFVKMLTSFIWSFSPCWVFHYSLTQGQGPSTKF